MGVFMHTLNQFLTKFITSHKIKQQIKYTFLIAVMFPILTVGVYSICSAKHQMEGNYTAQIISDSSRIKSTLFDITTSAYTYSENIINAPKYSSLFSTSSFYGQEETYHQLIDIMDSYHTNASAIASICIYTTNLCLPQNDFVIPVTSYDSFDWYDTSINEKWNTWKNVLVTDSWGNCTPSLTLVRRIGVTDAAYSAYLVITLNSNYIKNRLQNSDYFILCSVDDSSVFFYSSRAWIKKQIPFPENTKKENHYYSYTGPLPVGKRTALSNISTFAPYKTNNFFYISVSDLSAYREINHITGNYILILLLATLLPMIIIFIFSSYFSSRIEVLRNAMHQAKLGNYEIIDTFHGDDELSDTFHDLQATVNHIYQTEAEFYQFRLAKQQLINEQQKMEFKMLSNQINPHFLYNTLETIRMQALAGGNRDVATSVKLLGKSMRYVLENTGTDSTTLEKEIAYTKVYLSIQKLRFGDRVNYTLNLDPAIDLSNHRILPLLLQPVVENAITHGLEGCDCNGHIEINIRLTSSDVLSIDVTDNGCGIDGTALAALRLRIDANTPPDFSRSIGLYNINQRIKLLYGASYGLFITSTPGLGTTVTLMLPANYITKQVE